MVKAPGGARRRHLVRNRARWKRGNRKMLCSLLSVIPKGSSVVDLGAAGGNYVAALRKRGYDATGVDGGEGVERLTDGLVKWADLAVKQIDLYGRFDWAICIEVGEHIPRRLESVFLDNLASIPTKNILLTWSANVRGAGHVNCRSMSYISERMRRRGWIVDKRATETAGRKAPGRFDGRLIVLRKA